MVSESNYLFMFVNRMVSLFDSHIPFNIIEGNVFQTVCQEICVGGGISHDRGLQHMIR